MSTQSAQITPVILFSAVNVLLREQALQSDAHLSNYVNVREWKNP